MALHLTTIGCIGHNRPGRSTSSLDAPHEGVSIALYLRALSSRSLRGGSCSCCFRCQHGLQKAAGVIATGLAVLLHSSQEVWPRLRLARGEHYEHDQGRSTKDYPLRRIAPCQSPELGL